MIMMMMRRRRRRRRRRRMITTVSYGSRRCGGYTWTITFRDHDSAIEPLAALGDELTGTDARAWVTVLNTPPRKWRGLAHVFTYKVGEEMVMMMMMLVMMTIMMVMMMMTGTDARAWVTVLNTPPRKWRGLAHVFTYKVGKEMRRRTRRRRTTMMEDGGDDGNGDHGDDDGTSHDQDRKGKSRHFQDYERQFPPLMTCHVADAVVCGRTT
jgi:hypothetical protein